MKLRGWKIVVLALPLIIYGCGKTAKFEKQEYSAVAVAGQYTKPKLDILVFQDKSDSMISPMSYIKPQLNAFLTGLDSSWDFRFTVLPLQSTKNLNGKYIVAQDCSDVSVGYQCLSPSQSSTFNNVGSDYGWITSIDSNIGSQDYGFNNIKYNIDQSSVSGFGGFLRSDAALAVIVISNGEDISGISYWDPDGDGTPEINYNSSTSQNSLNNFTNYLSSVKGGGLLKFYPIVASATGPGSTSCYGSPAFVGWRYMQAASITGGFSYNLCNSGISTVMSSLGSQINALIQSIVFNYAVINEEPVPSSIVVKKNGSTIPQSNSNGWSYEGYKADSYTSYLPQLGNKKTGYFIKLNGTAAYKGTDMITVDYQKQ